MSRPGTRRRSARAWLAPIALAGILALACSGSGGGPFAPPSQPSSPPPAGDETPVFTFEVVATFPHDPEAFTQGLVFEDGLLLESTGLRGESTLRRVDLETGEVRRIVELDPLLFGEGIAALGDRIAMLTFTSRLGLVFDRRTFAVVDSFEYPHQGWGITTDGEVWIVSDGTSTLRFWDAETFTEIRRVEVTDGEDAIGSLNELEWVDGEVFANVWMTDRIARIDPATGDVTGWIDLTGLLPPEDRPGTDVLNGIAWDPGARRLFVTGKLWPTLFEIRLVEP